jgi:hypothetical protein
MTGNKGDPLQYVTAAFSGRKRARSEIYRWMLERYETLAGARASGHGRTDWIGVTAELRAAGVRGDKNKPLKPESVRRCWHRVDADVKNGVVKLPVPIKDVPEAAKPLPIASATSENFFSLTPVIEDDGFSLPDITGKKI